MARSDLILGLVKAGVTGDTTEARQIAEAIAADERSKKHLGVADRINRVLDRPPPANVNNSRPGLRVRDGSGGILHKEPERPLDTLFVESGIQSACLEIIEEQRRADLLRAHGLEPRHRVLFCGPPGNGKTSLAEALAYELALPLFTVRYEAVVTSYLGETAQRLQRLFEYVRTEPCVLFFDEFDAIGKERGDTNETGEIKRVVTTLLMQLDRLPSYCVLVCATNHHELLDRAAWRRFQFVLQIDSPSEQLMLSYFSHYLQMLGGRPGYTAKRLYDKIKPTNFSEAENFFEDIKRRLILSQGLKDLRAVIDDRVKAFLTRKQFQPTVSGKDA
ncbi:AAA family ATPase [Rhodobium gokarnense]|uniref:AAA+ superfamily predicted ATPase n=1 Tax=Rhodobium gokarnense TaxID=364296 RepID=A0ABT3HAD4_9HYPH|nr:AAA family ATPase [Rhodobium gokarnense]MCW2307362.1 AAA+ superfamily predicted ATPase [Rhodobium gokarnense]